MNTEQETIMRLSACVKSSSSPYMDDLPTPDWRAVYMLVYASRMDGILYPIVSGMKGEKAPDPELLNQWKKNLIPMTIRQMNSNNLTKRLAQGFAEKKIPYILFKGPVLADLYPSPQSRFSVDSDFLIDSRYADEAAEIFTKNGMIFAENLSKENVAHWNMPGLISVELHYRLWEDYEDAQTQKLDEMRLTVPESLLRLTTCCGEIITMGYTEHLIFQIFHIIKHMTFMGMSLRNIIDIWLFVDRYISEINIERFWRAMGELGYSRFCDALFTACVQYLGMTPEVWPPPRAAASKVDAGRFMSDIFTLCIKDTTDSSLNVASVTVYQMFHETPEVKKKSGRLRIWLAMLFPKRSALAYRYHYAKKYAFLLPAAWIHRGFYSLFGGRRQQGGLHKSMKTADDKVAMLRDLGLLK